MPENEYLEGGDSVPERTSMSGRLDTNWILSRQIDRLGAQVLKLPTEVYLPDQNIPGGIKYDDIKQSFVDGVNVLLGLIEPLEKIEDASDFKDAFLKFRSAVKALQNENLMYQREKHVILDEQDGVIYESQPEDAPAEQPASKNDMETPAP